MRGSLQPGLITLALAALAVGSVPLEAQQAAGGRFRVLIPYFEPLQGADDDFGKDASEELRELINTLATHQPIAEREIKDQLKRFDLKIEDLDCVTTRQLAPQINAQVVLCASYTEQGEERVVDAAFWDAGGAESFQVDQVTVNRREEEAAAQHIFGQFDRYVQQIRFAQFCTDYMASQQWDNALRNCDDALELNPTALTTRYQRARILYEMEDYGPALEELRRVLELNPVHEDALQLAGYISASEGMDDQARDYYSQYLELNPGNATIRMRIAYELAQAGDPVGAMEFIQVGLDVEPDNVNLLEQYGGFAFSAALEAVQAASLDAQDAGGIPPEAQSLYREAIQAYERVWEQKGAETQVVHLRNVIAAYVQLEELDAAITAAERVLETHSQEANLWSIYADALQRSDRIDEAITALDRVREINPSYPNVGLRQGNWLIQAGRVLDAVAILKESVAGNPEQSEMAARMVFADAYSNGVQKEQYDYAIEGIVAAKELPGLSSMMSSQLNFWHGYSLYTSAVKEQEPQTVATANTTLPKFQQALGLFEVAGEYADSQPSITLSQFLDGTNTYIEIQEAIIRRGR